MVSCINHDMNLLSHKQITNWNPRFRCFCYEKRAWGWSLIADKIRVGIIEVVIRVLTYTVTSNICTFGSVQFSSVQFSSIHQQAPGNVVPEWHGMAYVRGTCTPTDDCDSNQTPSECCANRFYDWLCAAPATNRSTWTSIYQRYTGWE